MRWDEMRWVELSSGERVLLCHCNYCTNCTTALLLLGVSVIRTCTDTGKYWHWWCHYDAKFEKFYRVEWSESGRVGHPLRGQHDGRTRCMQVRLTSVLPLPPPIVYSVYLQEHTLIDRSVCQQSPCDQRHFSWLLIFIFVRQCMLMTV
jgi:hypothetical protein